MGDRHYCGDLRLYAPDRSRFAGNELSKLIGSVVQIRAELQPLLHAVVPVEVEVSGRQAL